MGQQGTPGELFVDPQDLILPPGGTGLYHDFGTTSNLQLGYDTSVYPQSSGNETGYLSSTNLDLSGDGLDMRA